MNIWPFSKRAQPGPRTAAENPAAEPPRNSVSAPAPDTAARPVYQKPTLRRYDQIDQVKPYGPSEI